MKVNNKKIQCKYCSKVLLSKQSKYRDQKQCMLGPKDIKLHICQTCSYSFVRKDVLDRHKLTCQKRSRNKICQTCNKHFTRTEHLKRHLTTHSRVGYQRNFCERSFKRIDFYNKRDCSFSASHSDDPFGFNELLESSRSTYTMTFAVSLTDFL